MTHLSPRESQQSQSRPAGTWRLEPGRAMTLHPTQAGQLRVAQGQLWATLDGPHHGSLQGLGDLVVEPGAVLRLRAGQRVVIESARSGQPADFMWELAAEPQQVSVRCWQPVLQSWRELRDALALAGHAASGLIAGLAAVGLASLPRRMPGARMTA